jgi:hypothetical protein
VQVHHAAASIEEKPDNLDRLDTIAPVFEMVLQRAYAAFHHEHQLGAHRRVLDRQPEQVDNVWVVQLKSAAAPLLVWSP